jgi:hypothetical protein
MMHRRSLMLSSASVPPAILNAFSTDLYTGNGGSRLVVNGVDLENDGGLAWVKARNGPYASNATFGKHILMTQEVSGGAETQLSSNNTDAASGAAMNIVAGGVQMSSATAVNDSSSDFVLWSFRKVPRFFDVVTYTGTGSNATISHSLGVKPGLILIKRTDAASTWAVGARVNDTQWAMSNTSGGFVLNSSNASTSFYNHGGLTTTTFATYTAGANYEPTKTSGATYVAYVFAHDPEPDGIIQCGSYAGNGSATGPEIDLGWEPDWLMIKRVDSTGNWLVFDNERSPANPRSTVLFPDAAAAEQTNPAYNLDFTPTGFQPKSAQGLFNASGGEYIYMAIRGEDA